MICFAHRRGLTLLELVVVMVILIALAGILVPMLPGMLGKAHSAAHSTNINELNKAWELYNATYRGYPNGLDSLIEGDSGSAKVFTKLPGDSLYTFPTVEDLAGAVGTATSTTVNAAEIITRLKEAGITTVYSMNATATNATFDPYVYASGSTTPTSVTISNDTALCQINSNQVNATLNGNLSGVYVIFGVGSRCTAVGRGGIASAPVHFSDATGDDANPANKYQRFGVVFDLTKDPAAFVGAVAFHEEGISGSGEGVTEYFAGHHH